MKTWHMWAAGIVILLVGYYLGRTGTGAAVFGKIPVVGS